MIYTQFVSIPELILGTKVEVPYVKGNKLRITIQPGTQAGTFLRVKGKGIPDINGYGKGDLLVYVQPWTPKNLSREEKEIIEKLAVSDNFAPKPDKKDKNFFERLKKMFN